MELAHEQEPAAAEPAARAVLAGPGAMGPAQAQILMLQRHAGNAAVGRLLRARRAIQRDDLEQPTPLDDKKPAAPAGDRYDSLDPSNPSSKPDSVLRSINPKATKFAKYDACTQNCPGAASDAQNYLLTGAGPAHICNALNQPKGYLIDPGPENWGAKGKAWADAWADIQKKLSKHGTQVIVEADRGSNKPEGLTQWHYFVIMNAHGHIVAVDAFLGEVDADVPHYVTRLGALTYSYTSDRVTATPVMPKAGE
jgi:hypothetical protein